MEAKDTDYPNWIRDDTHLRAAYRDGYLSGHNDMIAQAEVSFKAGVREVVEWFAITCFEDSGMNDNSTYYSIPKDAWQAKLKEWGIVDE